MERVRLGRASRQNCKCEANSAKALWWQLDVTRYRKDVNFEGRHFSPLQYPDK